MKSASPVGSTIGIVGERRQPVLAAVLRPGVRRARRRDDGAEGGLAMTFAHGSGVSSVALEDDRVGPPVVGEAAEAVRQRHRRRRDRPAGRWRLRLGGAVGAKRRTPAAWTGCGSIELGAQVAAVAAEDRARDGLEQRPLRAAHAIGAQQVGAARPMFPRAPRPVVEERRELRVHLVEVAERMLVEDHDIGAQALEPPVLLRLQHLPHERHVVVADDADEQDRQIAGDAVRPQTRLTELVRRDRVGVRAQRAVGAEHPRREPLEQQRLVARDAQVAQAALRVREGQREGARRPRSGRGTSARAPRPSRDPRRCRWRRRGAPTPPGASRIRWRRLKIGSSTTPVVPDSARPSSAGGSPALAAAAEEARAIGFPFDRPLRPAFEAQHVERPRRRLLRIARPPMAEQRGAVGQVFGLEEQLAERRMREVVGRPAPGRSPRSW